MIDQILKNQQPGQPPQTRTPDLEQKVKDEIVMREIFIQEAERRGLNTSPDYKVQMEFARQSILIRSLFQDFEAKNQMSEAEARAEYDKIKAANGAKELRARHILVEGEDEAKSLLAKIKAAGFAAEDITVTPVDDTANLTLRYRGKGGKRPMVVTGHMDVGMPRHAEVRLHLHAAGAVQRCAQQRAQR